MDTPSPHPPEPAQGRGPLVLGLLALLVLALLVLLVRTAWLCDDAYITFRTVDNLLAGHGLVWNVGERVLPSTHPLWMLLVALATWITGSLYPTVIALGIGLTLATALIAIRTLGPGLGSLTVLVILCQSRAFIDFSTSGLEDPLSHLLLASFLWMRFRRVDGPARESGVTAQALVIGLALTTRMDTLLLYLPALVLLARDNFSLSGLRALALGFTPFALWELFSLVYFGFLFPNSAYAKLGAELPLGEVCDQGLDYLVNSFQNDPLTLVTIGAGVLVTLFRRTAGTLSIALGTAFYLLYVVRIGGDFMSGRMLTLPLLAAAMLLGRAVASFDAKAALAVPLAALALGFAAPFPTALTGPDFGPAEKLVDAADLNGIADERMVYYGATGLLSTRRLAFEPPRGVEYMPAHSWTVLGYEARRKPPSVVIRSTIGYFGYMAGPKVYVVDANALSDALLARIPELADHKTRNGRSWRIGHLTRKLPKGYIQTLKSGENVIEEPELARKYDKLKLVISGPLFSADRWRAIWALNVGLRGE